MDRVDEILRKPYSRLLVRDQDGGFTARVIEFSGCFAEGDTAAEAAENLETAAEAWVEGALDDGFDIPPATGDTQYSGKFVVRLPRSLHHRCALLAQQEGVSLNQFVVSALAQHVGEKRTESKITYRIERVLSHVVDCLEDGARGWTIAERVFLISLGSMVEQGANEPNSFKHVDPSGLLTPAWTRC